MNNKLVALAALSSLCLLGSAALAQQQPAQPQEPMRFFVTSSNQTGNLGGLEGADKVCQDLAAAAGAGDKTWAAYLSTQGEGAVNARDRIGAGPWHNANGQLIAANVADLHGDVQRDRNQISKPFALDEMGNLVNGRGDMPNQHDIMTGSDSLGMAFAADAGDMTCQNYTYDGAEGAVMLGHHDRMGGGNSSWNMAHASRGGCGAEALAGTGGSGKFYCFATN